ncbi:glycoprotein 3-alpha-L-fucosyltransferase A-like [Strongylocentrotus purpuratus]|uniref:Fucosyltransferase n=1 Tax=Strongylocentrotus purpuratus TaxID=7668 RepID=A0A7M7NJ69_STRPU|nr:glycoprotein 3-alpha-L-fucosyltransferase A-like [Strongylocentrotus purpuratus]
MSYRFRESHLYGSYGRFNTDHPEMKFTKRRNWASHKTRPVAWVSSNCNGTVSWDRKGFVDALSRYVPVSMYRKSGTKDCPMDERCNRSIRKHKFYLALENSPCRDYISEELWRNALLNNLVPVVYGASKEDYKRVLPPDSFIHVEDFDSIMELALYLRKLSKDEGLYNTYFEWKKFGWVQLTTEEYLLEPEQVCENIVSRLLSDEKAMREGTYHKPKFPDWNEWWTNSCKKGVKWPIKLK